MSAVKSCDFSCPSPQPRLSSCASQEEEEGHHDNKKSDQTKRPGNQGQAKRGPKAKGRLVRSMAVCDDSSPLSDITEDSQSSVEAHLPGSTEGFSAKEVVQEVSIKQNKTSTLAKEPSLEYTDSTGIDLHQFLVDTLNSNPRDRMMLLKLEQEMIDYITSNSAFKKFPHMSSYHRMLVHRVAAYFGMEHNVDQTGKAVIVNRTSSTRIPEQRFLDEVQDKGEETQWKAILKRDNSAEDKARLQLSREDRQNKSMEEREEEYQRVRDRIFKQEPARSQEMVHTETWAGEEYNPYSETQRKRLLFRGSRDNSGSSRGGSSLQSSTEMDCRYGNDPAPWSSTDSDSSYHLTSPAPKPRPAANQGWEPHGAGSISLYPVPLPSACASSPSLPERPAPACNPAHSMENGIPPGSILMNPRTGKPFLNPDGTPIVYNPPETQPPLIGQPLGPPAPPQQPMAAHDPQQVIHYLPVSNPPPEMLPVTSTQTYNPGVDELSSQFAHVTMRCHSADAPPLYPPPQSYFYMGPPPPNAPNNCQPPPQMPGCYCSGSYPASGGSQPKHSHSQSTQPTGYPYALNIKPPPNQAQTMLGTYPLLQSHQCGPFQSGGSVSYPLPQSAVCPGPAVAGDGAYCYMVPPPCGQAPMPQAPSSCCQAPSCSSFSNQGWPTSY